MPTPTPVDKIETHEFRGVDSQRSSSSSSWSRRKPIGCGILRLAENTFWQTRWQRFQKGNIGTAAGTQEQVTVCLNILWRQLFIFGGNMSQILDDLKKKKHLAFGVSASQGTNCLSRKNFMSLKGTKQSGTRNQCQKRIPTFISKSAMFCK